MLAVPFKFKIYNGLGRCEGMIRDEGGHLAIDFQKSDAIMGLLKSDVKTVRIALKDLDSVTLVRGWLGTTWFGVDIVLQAAKLETLKDVPGMSQGKVVLEVERKDSAAAERLVAALHVDVNT